MARDASSQQWLDRAARDAKRLAVEPKTRYAIQLELACEAASLNDAFQHDRGPNMWVLTTSFQGKTCFRVLWGRYATIEAARRALSGAPKFFATPKNHPAVTGVR
jgi:septal ring-binding cell division protein DamX